MPVQFGIKICRMAVSHLGENSGSDSGMYLSGMPHHSTKDADTALENTDEGDSGSEVIQNAGPQSSSQKTPPSHSL